MATDPEVLREARDSYAVIYREVVRLYSSDRSLLLCIVEGKDGCYYNPRLQQWLIMHGEGRETRFLSAKGRDNVIKVRDAVDKNEDINLLWIMYFVDKDFSYPYNGRGDTFVTDFYSVENYYCSWGSARSIISHYILHDHIHGELAKGLDELEGHFEAMAETFANSSLKFHAWVIAQRSLTVGRVPLSSLDKLSSISIDLKSATSALEIDDEQLSGLPFPERHPDSEAVEQKLEEISPNWGFSQVRGKQATLFVMRFLASSREWLNERYGDSAEVHNLQISPKTFLSDFSQFASTPESLISFFDSYLDSRTC